MSICQLHIGLNITARQYGEVVLPDAIPADHLSRFFGRRFHSAGKGGYGTCFCRHGTSFIALRCDRGTGLLSGRELLPEQRFNKWALAQGRGTKLSRRQKIVKVQDFNCVQMCVSGRNDITDLSR